MRDFWRWTIIVVAGMLAGCEPFSGFPDESWLGREMPSDADVDEDIWYWVEGTDDKTLWVEGSLGGTSHKVDVTWSLPALEALNLGEEFKQKLTERHGRGRVETFGEFTSVKWDLLKVGRKVGEAEITVLTNLKKNTGFVIVEYERAND